MTGIGRLAILALAGWVATGAAAPGAEPRLPPGGDFTLTDARGAPFRLADQRGKVVLLFFGYTSCTEACPMMLARVNAVFEKLGRDRGRALAVFVSLDPARDTPEVLRGYLEYVSARTVAVTGTRAQLDDVTRRYEAPYAIEASTSALGYQVSHCTDLFLIDAQGVVRARFAHTEPTARITSAMKGLLH